MNTKDELLKPVWYEKGTPENGTFIYSRHSTGNTTDEVKGVCQYDLHPLRKADINLLLYHTVWDLLSGDGPMDFYQSECGKDSAVRNQPRNGCREWVRPLLIFSSAGTSLHLLPQQSIHPFFIAGYALSSFSYGESGIHEEDDRPLLSVYFVPEWANIDHEAEVVYRELSTGRDNEKLILPEFKEYSEPLKKAIEKLLAFLRKHIVMANEWEKRMELSLRMIDTQANELHILHNAGLYDIDSLWSLLLQHGLGGQELFDVSLRMNCCLHQYAMTVINMIDWQHGGKLPLLHSVSKGLDPNHLPPGFWDNVPAMEKAFEWTPTENALLTQAFYGTNRHNSGADYVEVLRELVRKRLGIMTSDKR